jgi:hypothetical protein
VPRTLAGVRGLVVVAAIFAAALAVAGASARGEDDPGIFGGLATWVDVYDTGVYRAPEATAARIAARGVRTVFAETANDRSAVDVVDPVALGRLVDALHQRGIAVVAWYLPGFTKPGPDLRRTRAMLSFRTPAGEGFDAVALDIESLRLRNVGLRSQRLLALARSLDTEAGDTPVAAITYPARAFERHQSWWPGFPWSELVPLFDAFVPMAYTGGGFRGYDATYGYVTRSLRLLRAAVGQEVPLHAAGGVANRMNTEELKAFADAVADDGIVAGWSLYDYTTTRSGGWNALRPLGGTR